MLNVSLLLLKVLTRTNAVQLYYNCSVDDESIICHDIKDHGTQDIVQWVVIGIACVCLLGVVIMALTLPCKKKPAPEAAGGQYISVA
jgi:hypothetical protein